ncbi:MAG: hypothetical protein ACOZNI_02295 [Myxococcota bacterium]
MILALLACGPKPEPAPPTFDQLCRDAYGDFDDDLLADHVAGIRDFLSDGEHEEPEGWGVDTLDEDDVAGLERPDRSLADAPGAAAQAPSPHGLDSHVALVMLADQSVVGSNYEKFERTFLEGEACFADGGCDLLRTWNDIVKDTLGVRLPYAYEKDYRRVGDDAVAARGWVAEEAFSDDGSSAIHQSFNLDLFYEDGGGVRRLQVQWAELDLGAVSDVASEEQLLDLSVDSLLGVFEDTDEAIEELGL